jgi:3-oxoadipate enol-lactonase
MSRAEPRLYRTGHGPPVILLHCLGVDRRVWDGAVAGLAGRFTTLTYDFPGHGERAPSAAPVTIESLADELEALLDREGIARATIAGISLGGLVAQAFAATRPGRVDRLVLVDTTARYTDELRTMWAMRAATARTQGVSPLIDGLLAIWFTEAFRAANPPAVRYVRETLARASGEGYAQACEALAAADLRASAPAIDAPTLVVCGDQDLPSFLDAARWLAETIPGARLEWLAPAKHASMLEQPEKFSAALLNFLTETL